MEHVDQNHTCLQLYLAEHLRVTNCIITVMFFVCYGPSAYFRAMALPT
jgi:hypothetical protein